MDIEKFDKLMDEYLERLSVHEPDSWSSGAREWAEREGLIIGDENGRLAYKRFLTREEFIQLAYRAAEKLKTEKGGI